MKSSKTILVSGATGLVGRALCSELRRRGHFVRALSRGSQSDVCWDVEHGRIDAGALAGVDCVVHLAGESVAQRWSRSAKQRILDSRVKGAELLVGEILRKGSTPAFITASGVNYYGYACDAPVDENSPSGDGFLAEVCRQWEGAARPLADAGLRTVAIRTGLVLSTAGGALAKMLPPFKMGMGGRVGSGTQKMSWIGLPDLVAVYVLAIEDDALTGPINGVAPAFVSNADFAETLGQVLGRPAALPFPSAAVKMFFGEMGQETLLGDVGVVSSRLQDMGFQWLAPELRQALEQAGGTSNVQRSTSNIE